MKNSILETNSIAIFFFCICKKNTKKKRSFFPLKNDTIVLKTLSYQNITNNYNRNAIHTPILTPTPYVRTSLFMYGRHCSCTDDYYSCTDEYYSRTDIYF